MELEVTWAHTNLFLTCGWGIEELRCAQILNGNLALLLPCKVATEQLSTVYAWTWAIFLSKQEPEIFLDMLLTRPRAYLYQVEAVHKSRPETIFKRCYSFMLYTTGRKRVVGNAKGHSDLFRCADYHVCAVKYACSCWQLITVHKESYKSNMYDKRALWNRVNITGK